MDPVSRESGDWEWGPRERARPGAPARPVASHGAHSTLGDDGWDR